MSRRADFEFRGAAVAGQEAHVPNEVPAEFETDAIDFKLRRVRCPSPPDQSVKVALIEQGGDTGHTTTQEPFSPVSRHYNTDGAIPTKCCG